MKKLFTLLIATLCTIAAFAEDNVTNLTTGTGYGKLDDAVKAAADGDIIQVNKNATVSNIMQGINLTLTIQGKSKDVTLTAGNNTKGVPQCIFKMATTDGTNSNTNLTVRNLTLTRVGGVTDATNSIINQANGTLLLDNVEFKNIAYTGDQYIIRAINQSSNGSVVSQCTATTYKDITFTNCTDLYDIFINQPNYQVKIEGDANYSVRMNQATSSIDVANTTPTSSLVLYLLDATKEKTVVYGSDDFLRFYSNTARLTYPTEDGNLMGAPDVTIGTSTKKYVAVRERIIEGNKTYKWYTAFNGSNSAFSDTDDPLKTGDRLILMRDANMSSTASCNAEITISGIDPNVAKLTRTADKSLFNSNGDNSNLTIENITFYNTLTEAATSYPFQVQNKATAKMTLRNVKINDFNQGLNGTSDAFILRCNLGTFNIENVTLENCTMAAETSPVGVYNVAGSTITGNNSEMLLRVGNAATTSINCAGLETPLSFYVASAGTGNNNFITGNTDKRLFTITNDDWALANNSNNSLTLYQVSKIDDLFAAPTWPEIPTKDVTVGQDTYQHFDSSDWWISHDNGVMHYPFVAKLDADKTGTVIHFNLEKVGLGNASLLYHIAPYSKIGDEEYLEEPVAEEGAGQEEMAMVAYADGETDAELPFSLYDHNQGLAVTDESNITLKLVHSDNHDAASEPLVLQVVNPEHIQTGIENVAAANAVVEYYTLQGVRVANPGKGIYIRRQGAKTSKVVL